MMPTLQARLASTMPGPPRVVIATLKFQAARWDPGQHEILYLVFDDSRAADVQHALVLVRRQRAEARRRSRREDHRLVLTRHAPLDLHRGGMSLGKRNNLNEETVRFGC
jgi:hypothetical protein